jgi:hypothetical protein
MTFEIWDLTTRNLSGFFHTRREALEAIKSTVETHGRAYAEDLALVQEDTRGRSRTIALGVDLVELALS